MDDPVDRTHSLDPGHHAPQSILDTESPNASAEQPADTEPDADDAGDDDDEEGGSEDDESTDDESEEKIANPCIDIKTALTAALKTKPTSNFQGSFAFSKTYQDAPMPGLRVAGLGSLALPLTKKSAQKLIKVCEQAPFGKGERTIVDKSVRDTWELAPEKVSFDNRHWTSWLNNTMMPHISQSLGVTSTPKCELYKLLVYEKGSHFLPHQDTEKAKGMFGTVIIVLPSAFEGGQLHMSHSGQTKIFDIAADSNFCTSVMAWYSDVRHEVKPITSGYRLALSYNLIGPTGSPRPGLSGYSQTVSEVRHVLMSWRQSFAKSTPDKLAYILDHEYSAFGIGTGVLKGADAHKIEILRSLAKECRFKIYLASAKLHVTGQGEGYDDDDYEMGCVSEKELTIEDVVDLDGEEPDFADEDLDLKNPDDFIPHALDHGTPDDEEYEGYMGNHGGELQYWYNQTVILIWPRNRHDVVLGEDWLSSAALRLKHSDSTSAMPREKKLVERVLFRIEGGAVSDDACRELLKSALRWKDAQLWLRIARIAKIDTRSSVLTCQDLADAAVALGFGNLGPLLTNILFMSPSNAYRLDLIAAIADSELSKESDVATWCDSQRDLVLQSLKVATQDDVPALVSVARSKGIAFVQSSIIPQLLSQNGKRSFWFAFLEGLYTQRDAIGPSAQEVTNVVKMTLTSLLNRIDPLTVKPGNPNFWTSRVEYDPEPTIQLIKTCLKLESPELCSIILEKLIKKNSEGDESTRKARTSQVFQPVMTALVSYTNSPYSINLDVPPFLAFMKMVASDVIDISLSQWDADWGAVIDAAKVFKAQGIVLLGTKVMAHLEQRNTKPDLACKIARLLKQKWSFDAATEEEAAVQKLIQTLVIVAISRSTVLYEQYSNSSYAYSTPDYLQIPKDLLLLCFDTDNAALSSRLLNRLKTPQKEDKQHFTKVALPFIVVLCQELASRGISSSSDPYGPFCRDVLVTFVDKVLGAKPPANAPTPSELLARIGCSDMCSLCDEMIRLLQGSEATIEIRRAEKDRKHLERQAASSRLGFTFKTIRGGSPLCLQITKPASLTAFGTWHERKDIALKAIKAIGSHRYLQEILGDDYARIMALLGLAPVPTLSASSSAAAQSGSSGRSGQTHLQSNNAPRANAAGSSRASTSSASAPIHKKTKRAQPSTATATPVPRKRSKTSSEVIDLCSPSPQK